MQAYLGLHAFAEVEVEVEVEELRISRKVPAEDEILSAEGTFVLELGVGVEGLNAPETSAPEQ